MALPYFWSVDWCRIDWRVPLWLCFCIPFIAHEKDWCTPMDLTWKHVRIAFYDPFTWGQKWNAYLHENSSGNLPWNYVYEWYITWDALTNRQEWIWEFPMRCGVIPWRWGAAENNTWARTWFASWKCCYRIWCIDRTDLTNIFESLIQYGEICFVNTTRCL